MSANALHETKILGGLLCALLCWYMYHAYTFFQGAMPYHSFDEYEYFLTPRALLTSGSWQTPFLEQDAESPWGFGAHGIAYVLLHASIQWLIGEHWWNLPLFNCLAVGAACLSLILERRFTVAQRLLLLILLLTCFITPLYTFSFMQESLHVCFAVWLAQLLFRLYRSQTYFPYVLLFIVLVAFATLFRAHWVFWYWALVPRFYRNRYAVSCAAFLATLGATLYLYYVQAPHVVGFLYTLSRTWEREGLAAALLLWQSHVLGNIYTYVRWYFLQPFYFFTKYFFLFLGGYFTWNITQNAYRIEERWYIGIYVVGTMQFGALFLIYDTVYWRDVRMLAPLLMIIFYMLVAYERRLAYAALLGQLLCLLWLHPFLTQHIYERTTSFDTYRAAADRAAAFAQIPVYIAHDVSTKPPIILISREFVRDGMPDFHYLPFVGKEGLFLRYAVYYAPIDTAPNLTHDYMLLPISVPLQVRSELDLLLKNKYFHFYKVHKEHIPVQNRHKIL